MAKRLVPLFVLLAVFVVGCTSPVQPGPGSGLTVSVKWFVARGAPASSQGADGDLYLDTDTTILYVRENGAWQDVAALRGPSGSGWLLGTGAPSASLGNDGDLYLDTASTNAYRKSGGAWTLLFTLEGATGATGPAGASGAGGAPGTPGAPGATGAPGVAWLTGSGDPNAADPALTASDGAFYLDTATAVVYRRSGGAWSAVVSFQIAAAPQYAFTPNMPATPNFFGVAYGKGLFVAVATSGTIITSADGTDWNLVEQYTKPLASVGSAARSAAHRAARPSRVEAGKGSLSRAALSATPPRGIVFSEGGFASDITADLYGVAFGAGVFVAVGAGSALNVVTGKYDPIWTSTDGTTWTAVETTDQTLLYSVAYENGVFVAFGEYNPEVYVPTVLTSTDGITWTQGTLTGGQPNEIMGGSAFGNGTHVAVGWNGSIMVSADGSAWTTSGVTMPGYTPTTSSLFGVAFGDGTFVAVGSVQYSGMLNSVPIVLRSTGGLNWTSQDLPLNASTAVYGVTYGTAGFVAVGSTYLNATLSVPAGSVVLSSPNGTSWSVQRWDELASSVAFGPVNGGVYVVTRGDSVWDY